MALLGRDVKYAQMGLSPPAVARSCPAMLLPIRSCEGTAIPLTLCPGHRLDAHPGRLSLPLTTARAASAWTTPARQPPYAGVCGCIVSSP